MPELAHRHEQVTATDDTVNRATLLRTETAQASPRDRCRRGADTEAQTGHGDAGCALSLHTRLFPSAHFASTRLGPHHDRPQPQLVFLDGRPRADDRQLFGECCSLLPAQALEISFAVVRSRRLE